MPIRPPPTTYVCPVCGWTKTVAPRSDCLMPGDSFVACPACSHEPLEQRAAGMGARLLSDFGRLTGALRGQSNS